MIESPVNGERVRALRLAQELSQTDLATLLGMKNNSVISKLETGRSTVDEDTRCALAAALHCRPDFLGRPLPDALASRPWLRAYSDARAKTLDSILADNLLAHELSESLGLRKMPVSLPMFDDDLNDFNAIEEYAAAVRAAAQIVEDGVVGNVMRSAERLGIIVLPMEDELGRHMGLSQYIEDTPYLRVARDRVPGDRQRFTVAHEIGHLGLHADLPPPASAEDARHIEAQAHRFAGAYIAPAEPLLDDLRDAGGRVTLTTLAQLKSKWGLAIKALVVRFRNLGVISDQHATSLYKQISKRGWNTAEPVAVTTEKAVWLTKRLRNLAGDADPISWAVQVQGLDAWYLHRWLDWESEAPRAEVHDFPSRPVAETPHSGAHTHPGNVSSLAARQRQRASLVVSKD